MKTIELTEQQYKTLLEFKNYVSFKTRDITNPEITKMMPNIEESLYNLRMVKESKKQKKFKPIPRRLWKNVDFEPEYSFGECISDAIGSIWHEQETGEVDCIT